jgi:carbamoyl-phosphate synthase large subunit
MNWKNKKVFISGGAGVIGRELVHKLHAQGAVLYEGDLKAIPADFPKDALYRQGDLNEITQEEIAWFAPEYFIHLAATFERSTESYEFWPENFRHNVRLSNYLMTLMKDLPSLKKVVYASSYLIYSPELYSFQMPQQAGFRLNETHPIYPRNMIGCAKLLHEIELRFINDYKSSQYKSISVRIFRGYGRGSKDVISRWVRDLLQGKKIDLYAKEGMFDYIYGRDTAEGLLRLAASEEAEGIVNLGTGRSRRVSDVVAILGKHFRDMQVQEHPSDLLFEASECDTTLFRQYTGWLPEYDLEQSIPEIIEYERAGLNQAESVKIGNVLVTSISKKVPLLKAVKKAAQKISGEIKVFGGDLSPEVIGAYFVDEFYAMKRIADTDIEDVITYCREKNITLIIPTRDGELAFWAQHADRLFAEGITVNVSSAEAVDTCIDKMKFAEVCRQKNIPAIPTYAEPEGENRTWVVKERFGAGSEKLKLNATAAEAKEFATNLSDAIFQPFIKGTEYSVDSYVSKAGELKGLVIRKRSLVVNGESQITEIEYNSGLEQLFADIIRTLNLRGPLVLQALVNDKGVHVIECNPRFGGATTLSVHHGLDIFYWSILEANGTDISPYPFVRIKGIKKQIRFNEDLLVG